MIDGFKARLKELHKLTTATPMFNPVFQLSLELSRKIEVGETDLKTIETYIRELECEALQNRAHRLQNLIAPIDIKSNLAHFKELVINSTNDRDFAQFAKFWSRPLLTNVFTAHPTFLLNKLEADSVAHAASSGEVDKAVCIFATENDNITLDYEHDEAMATLSKAHDARDALTEIIYEIAAKHYPEEFHKLCAKPFKFATWVGYDMDGRTDISWSTSFSYRLKEKSIKLANYVAKAKGLNLDEIAARLEAALQYNDEILLLFKQNLTDPAVLSDVANKIDEENANKILSLKEIIVEIEKLARDKNQKDAVKLLAFASAMRSEGLGVGQIHFRLNAAQLNNAIRRHFPQEETGELSSQSTIKQLDEMIRNLKPLRTNFASLAIETTTALRQFLAMVQIFNHIDADNPIRLLIAECEQPQTVLIALYFARLFGIEEKIDISPLFETETAMEHGARFLDALLGDVNYRHYAIKRGLVAIQTGFSDAGRFVGQIPASLAIERLHGRLARIMAKHDLDEVEALIFNTHGESMGRGAHPVSMYDRLYYNMSHWARYQFASRNIGTRLEVSFQGGDGYLFFRTPELALATLVRIAEVETKPIEKVNDPFYTRTDLSLDFYRGIRRVQREFMETSHYSRAITSFGLGLLKETGSRKSRRQSDIAADRDMSLRQIRAIPHNAVLQQLGYPVNLLAGVGTAAKFDLESIADLLKKSERGQAILRMLQASNTLASIKSLAAYGELFNCAYWATRPYRGQEKELENAFLALSEQLEKDDRPGEFRRLASSLRVDALRLHQIFALVDGDRVEKGREDTRRSMGVLHALRLALMQHMFLRAVQIPQFSRRNDISRDDILEMIFTLRIDDALRLLRAAFPLHAPSLSDFSINAPSDYPKDNEQAYEEINRLYFDQIETAYRLCVRISVSIANYFGAHG